jgi:hypothetical protein
LGEGGRGRGVGVFLMFGNAAQWTSIGSIRTFAVIFGSSV